MENRGCTFALENHCPADTQIEIDTDAFRRVFLNILAMRLSTLARVCPVGWH